MTSCRNRASTEQPSYVYMGTYVCLYLCVFGGARFRTQSAARQAGDRGDGELRQSSDAGRDADPRDRRPGVRVRSGVLQQPQAQVWRRAGELRVLQERDALLRDDGEEEELAESRHSQTGARRAVEVEEIV